jgi:polyisoprenoid-binding protein YceI
MKANTKPIISFGGIMVVFGLTILYAQGQVNYRQAGISTITIAGTSTMHDWTMTSQEAILNAGLEVNPEGVLTKINSVSVTIPAESLKSGKSAMDKNAYNSLKTDKHRQITFQLTGAKLTNQNILCTGNLTIAGTTKPIEMEVTYDERSQGFNFKGSKKIKMTDYGVEPPTFMFGSIKTGNEITVMFDVTLAPIKL